MKKVWIYTHDPMLHMFYTEDEGVELFGEPDFGDLTEIPESLYNKFLKAKSELYEASEELEKIRRAKWSNTKT